MSEPGAGMEEGLRALSEFFIGEGTLGDALLRITELACEHSPADMAGITLLVDGKPRTGVFTEPEAPEIDETQYGSGGGPCLDAFHTQTVRRIDSTREDGRWPEFAGRCVEHGILSTLSLPVMTRGKGIGALNLYSRALAAFDDAITDDLTVFARQAAIVLANAQLYWDARELGESLNQALDSRATIDYALGILLARGAHSPEAAFQTLVRASQRENRKLRELAGEIVSRATVRSAEGAGPLPIAGD